MKQKTEWGKMRIIFLANKNLIFKLIEEGYSLKEILRQNPNLNISYDALASYVRKYFKKNSANIPPSLPIKTQVKYPTSDDTIKTEQKSRVFEHDTNKKLEDMI
ncbi:TraK family protein [Bartonella harrusi]|uniref:TraK family protein n=1 Tax=Bartonella harrusi TaxID=2961895 RepID=A0ABY5EQK0_9HYPH|nr:TraK family protein [Bartonella harrusi]UTO27676.1 TraK family protein [Bartonella harrusi]